MVVTVCFSEGAADITSYMTLANISRRGRKNEIPMQSES